MRNQAILLGLAAALSACAPGPGDVGENQSALLVIDSSAVATPPPATLPAARLPAGAYAERAVATALLQSGETCDTVRTLRSREFKDSASWHLERDGARGQVLFLRKDPPGPPRSQDEAALRQASLGRLAAWGLPQGEVLKVQQRRSMLQSEEDGALGPPAVHRYKTFVHRGINGVRVEGNRAVLTHGPDGALRRGLLRWPPLAAAGHRLRTPLGRAEIVARAQAALAAAGETEGQAVLSWKYVPQLLDNGTVALKLMAAARLAAVPGQEATEEAREIDVDVSAQP